LLPKISKVLTICTNLLVETTSSVPPSSKVLRITVAQRTNSSAKLLILLISIDIGQPVIDTNSFSRILVSILLDGQVCSIVILNRSKKDSFKILVYIYLPESLPLPLVLAVAKILNPFTGVITSPFFFNRNGFPSNTRCSVDKLLLP